MSKIPVRVTLQPDGNYVWSAALDMDQEREGYKTGARIWNITAGLLFLSGVFLSICYRNWQPFLYMTAFTVVILLVTAGVSSGLNNWQGEHRRTYRMSDFY